MSEDLTRNVQAFAPYVTILLPFLFLGFVAWLQTKFVPLSTFELFKERANSERADLREDLADETAARLVGEEKLRNHLNEYAQPPSRHQMSQSISDMGAELAGLKAEQRATNSQLGTMNNYLHTLLERPQGAR